MKLFIKLLFIPILLISYSFTTDYDPFIMVFVNNNQAGTIQWPLKKLTIEDLSLKDTLSFYVYMDTGLPDDGMLILEDDTSKVLVIKDKENKYNQHRDNGKKYVVAVKTLDSLQMKNIAIYHSSKLWDSLNVPRLYYGNLKLN